MDLIERLKKKKIINENNTFNTNKEEHIDRTINESNTKIQKYSSNIPNYENRKKVSTNEVNRNAFNRINNIKNELNKMRRGDYSGAINKRKEYISQSNLWEQITKIANSNSVSQNNTIGTININNNNINNNIDVANTMSAIQGVNRNTSTNNKDIYNREVKNQNTLPIKANLATEEEVKGAKRLSIQEVEAKKEAEKINEQIEEGGHNKVNAIISNALTGFQGGIQQGIGGVANAGLTVTAGILQKVKDEAKKVGILNEDLENILDNAYNKVLDNADYISDTSNKNNYKNSEIKDSTVKTTGTVSEVIGNMIPSIASNILAPGSGLIVTGVSAGGNSAQENINNDRDNIYQSIATGTAKGLVEAGTEKIAGGNILSKGSLDDIVGKTISEKIKSNIGKAVANKSYQFVGEMLEEQISDNAGYLIDKIINGKELPSFNEWWNNAGETNKTTFLSTLALNLVGLGGGNISDEYETKMLNDVTKIAENDVKIQNKVKNIKEQIQNQSEIVQDGNNNIKQQITQDENKIAQNPMSEQTNASIINYQYQATDNSKINNLRQDMSKYWKNTNETKALGSVIEKVISDKGYNVRLDDSLNKNGSKVNAQITTLKNGEVEIRINPNSQNVGEFLLMHETTHAIGTKEMKDLVIDYTSKDKAFNQALENLKQTYSTDDVSDEVLADISGQLFGNQEFINNISMKNPSMFKKIYNKIIEWANKITGNSHEALFIRDLKNKWETAYRTQNNNLNENTYYSIQEDNNGNKYVKVDTDQDIFKGKTLKEQKEIAKQYILDNFREKGLIKDNDTVNISRKTANEYTNPKNMLPNADLSNKLRASTELDNLLNISTYKYSNKDDGRHIFAKNGWDYYETTFQVGDKTYTGLLNIAKGDKGKNLYDITKIKERTNNISVKTESVVNSFSNKSILPTNQKVNRDTTTKYSMQENKNNSLPTKEWSEYIKENYKATGTRTNLEDIKLPAKQNSNIKANIPTRENIITDEDYNVLNKIYEKEERTEILPKKQTTTEEKTAQVLGKLSRDKVTLKESADTIMQKVVNKGHYIDQLADKTNNKELKFAYDRALNSQAEGQYVIGVAQTDNNGNKIGKSINEIWKPVEESKLIKEFSEYLLHKHNIDRSAKKKYVFGKEIGPDDSTRIALDLSEKHPEFKKWEKDIKQFNDNNLNNLKEAGLLTQDTIDYIKAMYPNYVSIARAIEGNEYGKTDKTGVPSPLKKAVGGNADIQPLKDAMAEQVIRVKRLVNENRIGVELSKSLKSNLVENEASIEYTPDLLMNIDSLIEEDSTDGSKYYIFFEKGKQKKLKINNNLYESLKKSEQYNIEKTLPMKVIQKVSNIHRSSLTSDNPVFVFTNFFKDFQDGMFNSKYSSKFVKNYGKALSEIVTKGKYYESYMANGGMTNTYFDYDKGVTKKNKFVEKIRNVNEIVEQTPRLAEFISTIEDGKSLNEALYNSAEVTTNFKRGGDIAKALNRNGAEFLNASIQGFDKQFRNITGQNGFKGYVNLLSKATILGVLPSVLNHLLLDDDEDYKDLPQSTKDLYYLFKIGEGKFLRIPKGRVLSIFGAAARRTIEGAQGQDDAWEGFGDTFVNQVAPNNPKEDNIFSPINAVRTNKTWYGSDLVSSRLQKELPKNQYDETTDELSKWLGNKLNISPKKINYLLDQYSGGIGDILLPKITPQAKENVFVDKFTTDSVLKNKNVSKFYSTIEKQTQIANDSLATDTDKLQLKYLNSRLEELNDLYKEKREVQMNKDISQKEKKEKVRDIQQKIDNTAEDALEKYSQYDVNSDSAEIGDNKYYKNDKGNWTQISEETEEKNKNISTSTYADYKQKTAILKKEKINSGELKKAQDLKNKDKIQILLDSKYSEKEIGAIYEEYIKSENDSEYSIMKTTGINIKEYLKYKQQEFESDKKDDGTLKGKTINKSKQKKVETYLNSMKITGNQRLLLYAMQGYTTTSSQKKQLAKYVYDLDIKKDDKLKLYNKFSGFKVYKDGRVTW